MPEGGRQFLRHETGQILRVSGGCEEDYRAVPFSLKIRRKIHLISSFIPSRLRDRDLRQGEGGQSSLNADSLIYR